MNQCCVRSIIQLILSWMQFTVLVFCAVSIKVHFPHHFSHRNLDELTLKIIFLQTHASHRSTSNPKQSKHEFVLDAIV